MRTVERRSIQGSTKQQLQTAFSRVGERRFSGYAVDPANLDQRFTIEITVDGYVVRVVRADSYVHELAQQVIGRWLLWVFSFARCSRCERRRRGGGAAG